MSEDLYAILKVASSASQADIKSAYRQIARKYHPDKNPGDTAAEEIFKSAAEAYRVLGDEELRAQYDRYGRAGGHRPSAPSGPSGPAASEEAGDVFNDIFGTRPRGGRQERPRRGASRSSRGAPPRSAPPPRRSRGAGVRGDDLRYTLELDLEDTVFGTERVVSIPQRGRCSTCGGTGARPGSTPQLCSMCSGSGQIQREQGFFSQTAICPECDGAGKRSVETCHDCDGRGESRRNKDVRVSVPAGVDAGARLRVRGEGDPGPDGGPKGDLIVVIETRSHPFFQRESEDLLVEVPVRFTDAILGATIEVPTLEGKVRMRIPPGSQSGRVFRLKGKGIPAANGRGRGDQRVRIAVEVPAHVSEEQRRLLERYAEIDEARDDHAEVREFEELMDRYYR